AGELEKARQLLEAASARAPLDHENHGHLAFVLASLDRVGPAIEHLERALRLDRHDMNAWILLRNLGARTGEPGRAAKLARELASQRPGNARTWVVLGELLGSPEDRAEALAALDRAIALEPTSVEAHDLKAVRLADAGRFDEARAECAPAAISPVPLPLMGRAAWIEARAGNLDLAVARMRTLLAEHPSYVFGWTCLLGWCRDRRDAKGQLEAAEGLLALDPQNAFALAMRGEARLVSGNGAGARADLVRSIELDPASLAAAANLFQLQLSDKDLEGAARTLALTGPYMQPEFRSARKVLLAGKQGKDRTALDELARLVKLPLRSAEPFYMALGGLSRSALAQVDPLLEKLSAAGEACPLATTILVQRHVAARKPRESRDALGRLPAGSKEWNDAVVAYVNGAVAMRSQNPFLELRDRHRELLRKTAVTWGIVGWGLINFGRVAEGRDWLEDWEERKDARPWMLANLAHAYRVLGNSGFAARVVRAALALPPDHATPILASWGALEDALDGQVDGARALVDKAEKPEKRKGDEAFVLELARAVLDARAGDFASARRRRRAAVRIVPTYWQRPTLTVAHTRTVRTIASLRGGWAGVLWRAWIAMNT
ncbi:MAG TPA: hypothetical protein VFF73_32615, partial [Planctomycetota bacterium]|nr:hypothetical protein [Planctomycetota bacterium]